MDTNVKNLSVVGEGLKGTESKERGQRRRQGKVGARTDEEGGQSEETGTNLHEDVIGGVPRQVSYKMATTRSRGEQEVSG